MGAAAIRTTRLSSHSIAEFKDGFNERLKTDPQLADKVCAYMASRLLDEAMAINTLGLDQYARNAAMLGIERHATLSAALALPGAEWPDGTATRPEDFIDALHAVEQEAHG